MAFDIDGWQPSQNTRGAPGIAVYSHPTDTNGSTGANEVGTVGYFSTGDGANDVRAYIERQRVRGADDAATRANGVPVIVNLAATLDMGTLTMDADGVITCHLTGVRSISS